MRGDAALSGKVRAAPSARPSPRKRGEGARCLTPAQRKAFFLPPEPPDWCIEMEKWPYNTPEWKQWLADKRAGKTPPLPEGP